MEFAGSTSFVLHRSSHQCCCSCMLLQVTHFSLHIKNKTRLFTNYSQIEIQSQNSYFVSNKKKLRETFFLFSSSVAFDTLFIADVVIANERSNRVSYAWNAICSILMCLVRSFGQSTLNACTRGLTCEKCENISKFSL